ncbi:hypothetical protein PUNSTDRAFT_69324 [Punctularia strigosozonata HHB-11173 SS5]|uniref:uncharacterized protein n=1 Tax=Punctularia strigosozonata (strain HHB-11173) TaxID=741275 RepID=UPI0004417751|nr:uncharacterized protein PUNSTDRAFT_69324 [Punctularia strigosozonata HHB-11173 SS5]EIN08186.1 hypothetical protein PUNSTDRAFT_69324 [Punctularia strigosozonata HHB-11173 SS5]
MSPGLSRASCLDKPLVSFSVEDILALVGVLEVPEPYRTESHHCFHAVEALCLLLARYRNAGTLADLTLMYDRSTSSLTELINSLTCYLERTWGHLLDFDHSFLLSSSRLVTYCQATQQVSRYPSLHIWAFLDCTFRGVCRPVQNQRVAYNGHFAGHALKYSALVSPDGLIVHLFGPVEGRHNDNWLLRESHLLQYCEAYARRPDVPTTAPPGEQYMQVYGDSAYGVSHLILSPFNTRSGGQLSAEQRQFNDTMGSLRVEVEHGFAEVLRYWPFLRMCWVMKIYWSPVGIWYRVGVLLTNARNCLHPNQISRRFACPPPTLEQYFHH